MKKLYYAASLLALASLSVLTGCKKDTEPFPTKAQSNGVYLDLAYTTPWFPTVADADGIFISAQVTDQKTIIVSPFKNEYEYGMAKVASSTGNFNSLIDAGAITLNDSILNKSTALSYLSSISNYTINLTNSVTWTIQNIGLTYTLSSASNPSYTYDPAGWDSKWTPLTYIDYTTDYVPPRPQVTHLGIHSSQSDSSYYNANIAIIKTYLTDSTKRAQDSVYDYTYQYSVPIQNFVSNADSVYITLIDNNGYFYRRTNLPTDAFSQFRPLDFKNYTHPFDLTTFRFEVDAIKYNNTIVNSKKYYFLQMASSIKYYQATK